MSKKTQPSAAVADPALLQLINNWFQANLAATKAAAHERTLRDEVKHKLFPKMKPGTKVAALPNDYTLQCVINENRSLDEAVLPAVLAKLEPGAEEFLIRRKPELIADNYKKLDPARKKIFDEALTIKPSTPALKLIAPKRG